MPRTVLHVIDADSPQACPATLALLATSLRAVPDTAVRVLLLGGQPLRDAATAAGLDRVDVIGVPYGKVMCGLPAIIRWFKNLGPVDLVHAWSVESFRLAKLLRGRTPRVITLTQMPAPGPATRLFRLLTTRTVAPMAAITLHEALRQRLVDAGIPARMVHVARPGMNAPAPADSRDALRRRLGLTTSDSRVIALLSDPAHAADAYLAGMVVGLTRESLDAGGRPMPLHLLVHPAQHRRLAIEQLFAGLGSPVRLIQEPALATPWKVLPGCDATLTFGPHSGGLSLRWAMACGCPLVADPTPAALEQLEPERHALVATSGRPKALAHQLCRLMLKPDMAAYLADNARRAIAADSTWTATLADLYDRALPVPQRVAPQPASEPGQPESASAAPGIG